jgi:hypothetical protein
MLENYEKGYVKAIIFFWKLSTLKGRLKIKEGECLSSLGKTKEVSIKKRHNKYQKSIQKKNYWATNMTFGIHDKVPDVIRWLRLIIHQRKKLDLQYDLC